MPLWYQADDVERVARALGRALPRPLRNLQELGQGFTSIALESDDGLVFSVAKDEYGARNRGIALALLPAVAPSLPLAVPTPEWSIDSAEDLPYGAYAYRKIPGRSLTAADTERGFANSLVQDLAAFLLALHTFPVDRALALNVRDAAWHRESLTSAHIAAAPFLEKVLSLDERRELEAWRVAFLNDPVLWSHPPALIHCDFWYENILVNDDATRVAGVLDLSEAAVWDIAHDFATLRAGGDEFAIACMEAYETLGGRLGRDILPRVERHTEHWEGSLAGLEIALRFEDYAEAKESIAKLRASPILNPAARNLL
jgi:aminoglycoside phosphotransferase (APT) family kinase protein